MKRLFALLLSLALCLSLSACAAQGSERVVVASFYPVYIFAENLLDGVPGVRLTSLTPPTTGCLHDYQLLTSDMRALADASLLLVNGAGMESFLPDVQKQYPALPVADCSAGVALLADEHGENAHIWLDPKNAIQMAQNMAAGLMETFPEHEAKIKENLAAYQARLTALDKELAAALQALPNKNIATFHEAFPYFANAYGLNVVACVTLDPDEAPSPKALAEVVELIKGAGGCPLFSEPDVVSPALTTVQSETGAPLYVLDPVTTGDGAPSDYEDKMRLNARTLCEALQ